MAGAWQAYNFNYDYLDRLLTARHYDVSSAGTPTQNNRYNESLTYADARGNISTLKRRGGKTRWRKVFLYSPTLNLGTARSGLQTGTLISTSPDVRVLKSKKAFSRKI